MTPKQCKMARTGLSWSLTKLSEHAGIGRMTVARFESGQSVNQASLDAIIGAFKLNGANMVENEKLGRGVYITEPGHK